MYPSTYLVGTLSTYFWQQTKKKSELIKCVNKIVTYPVI